ncbi:MAG: Ig-like domain-containing protein [Bacteroidaceae bacterium]|nr:Ig-like domain-containing protein [Bacteroidaceae bacterium]
MKKLLYILITLTIILACASIGSPDGGRYDEQPPYVVATTPLDKSLRQSDVKKIRIAFNEYIKLENASEKVIVSPPQTEQPDLYVSGKKVIMTLFDTLQANTTYTIDFGDAILDNNESNPLGNYTYSFSTGDVIDTLELAGNVVSAENLEPVKGILVGLYRCDSVSDPGPDTLLATRRFERVSRTDGNGRFSIKGVAEGRYRVYALADMDGDYRFSQKSEMIGFDTATYVPYCAPDLRHDTIWRDSTHYEKIIHTPFMHFYPDNIVVRAFLEEGQAHYKLKQERPDPLKFTVYFTSPADSVPLVEGIGEDLAGRILTQPNPTNDTIVYWITDTALAYRDTLTIRMTYRETDTLNCLVPRTDTIDLVPRISRAKQVKELEKKVDDWVKTQEKRLKVYEKKLAKFHEQYPDSTYQRVEHIDTARVLCPLYHPVLDLTMKPSGNISPAENIRLTCPEPIDSIRLTHFKFQRQVDTLWVDEPFFLEHDSLNRCMMVFYAEWKPNGKYKLETDSMSLLTVYGNIVKPLKKDITVSSLDAYGSLFVHVRLPGADSVIVQLLDKSDKLLRERLCNERGDADFFYVQPGQYYIRCFIDSNGDGKWTTGEYATGRQPERMFYFPQPLTVRAKWEVDQDWAPLTIDEMKQKPAALIKQKEKKRSGSSAHERNVQRDQENKY